MTKYKKLRNQVINNIRIETRDFNNNRIDNAKDENEVWKVAKEIINPNGSNNDWSLKSNDEIMVDQEEIANTFNSYFVEKINDLKSNIDTSLVEDPLEKLKSKMEGLKNRPSLSIKPIKHKDLQKAFKKMKNKNSSGYDNVSH